jgi:hypothetical protein
MKSTNWFFVVTSARLVVLLSSFALLMSTGILNARDADLTSNTFVAVSTAKQQCLNICRSRYRDCRSLKQIPPFECRNVYQDCKRDTCNALPG